MKDNKKRGAENKGEGEREGRTSSSKLTEVLDSDSINTITGGRYTSKKRINTNEQKQARNEQKEKRKDGRSNRNEGIIKEKKGR